MMNLFWFLFGFLVGFLVTAVLASLILISRQLPEEVVEAPWERDSKTGRPYEFGRFSSHKFKVSNDVQYLPDDIERMRKFFD